MRHIEKEIRNKSVRIDNFDNISDLTSYINNKDLNRHFKNESFISSQTTGDSWSGTNTYSEAFELLQKGWSPKAEKFSKKVPVQTQAQTVTRSKPSYSVVGGQCSVPRYLQGIPTNMVHRTQTVQKDKIIVLHKSLSYSAMWSETRIEEEGIKALQVIQALENKGYRVKLNMFFATRQADEVLISQVCIKKPEERFSLIKMAFPLAHTGMLRRVLFRWIETNPYMKNRGFTGGYGRPDEATYKEILDKNEILLPAEIGDVSKYVSSLGL